MLQKPWPLCWLAACTLAGLIMNWASSALSDPLKPAVKAPANVTAREGLESFNRLIGAWRGTAQPRRGSAQGAWLQTGEFIWDFSKPEPAIRYVVAQGKLAKEGRFTWNTDKQNVHLQLQTPQGEEQEFTGNWDQDKLILNSIESDSGVHRRITLTLLNEKRTLELHEQATKASQSFSRIAEVGYTREGTHLAESGGSSRECIVTGGAGTSTVSYQGKTYYVCCSGCRQAFLDDPEGVLAEFAKRMEKKNTK